MNLDSLSQKQLNLLELQVRELLLTIRKTSLQNEPIAESLRLLEAELSEARRKRFDAVNPEFSGY